MTFSAFTLIIEYPWSARTQFADLPQANLWSTYLGTGSGCLYYGVRMSEGRYPDNGSGGAGEARN